MIVCFQQVSQASGNFLKLKIFRKEKICPDGLGNFIFPRESVDFDPKPEENMPEIEQKIWSRAHFCWKSFKLRAKTPIFFGVHVVLLARMKRLKKTG